MGDALIVVVLVLVVVVVVLLRNANKKQESLSNRQKTLQEIERMRIDGNVSELILKLRYGAEVQVRRAAARALGDLGDQAVTPLLDALTWLTYEQALEKQVGDWDYQVWPEIAGALDRLGWKPGQDHQAVCYWFAKQRWDKCLELKDYAVRSFIAMLKAAPYNSLREQAVEMLLPIFQEGGPIHKGIIENALESFAHDDYMSRHTDAYGDNYHNDDWSGYAHGPNDLGGYSARRDEYMVGYGHLKHIDELNGNSVWWLKQKGFDL